MKVIVEYMSNSKAIIVEFECYASNPDDCIDLLKERISSLERLFPPDKVPERK